jgi:phytoene synthase
MAMPTRSWTYEQWIGFEANIRNALGGCSTDEHARRILSDAAWRVLRNYSTSFFIVTRFLPYAKRRDVELIYAAVRYPDEIVDTFPFTAERKRALLQQWRDDYHRALHAGCLAESIRQGVSPFAAGFADVVRRYRIPPEHYVAFLDAMNFDIAPEPFATFDELIERYVYGSAIVVGYFLAYVYGTAPGHTLEEALASARSLGIALQLTNFLRDIYEDDLRSRCYVPEELFRKVGISYREFLSGINQPATQQIVREYARVAWDYYREAERTLGAFDLRCVSAIKACIAVYGELTTMLEQQCDVQRRASVPWWRKFACLPPTKYWIVPVSLVTPEYRP